MNMIEKIAAREAEFDGRELIAMPMADRKRYFQRARLAIETMREPTESMITAGKDADDPGCERANAETHWGSMIDAALAE